MTLSLACLVPLACSGDASDDGVGEGPADTAAGETDDGVVGEGPAVPEADAPDVGLVADGGHADAVAALVRLLPEDTRGVVAVDVGGLVSGGSDVAAWLAGDGADPALLELVRGLGALAGSIDVPRAMTSALLAQPTQPADGPLLLAALRSVSFDDVVAGPAPTPDRTYGPASHPLYLDRDGNQLALLPGGVLVVGSASVVESVLDVADGAVAGTAGPIGPFLGALDGRSRLGFVFGLPALLDATPDPAVDPADDLTLRGAAVVSGSLDVVDGEISGELAFHTASAEELVERYNTLDLPSTQGEEPLEEPLTLAEPIAAGLRQVVVTIPPTPVDPTREEALASRNVFKKLFVGMEAQQYAEGVGDPGNAAWVDLLVKSEEDGDTPPSPGSVFIRWEFRDQAAIDAFEANELPAGFTLAPTRFLESDDPDGEYFLALNLYNSGGGSIVSGMRAEWDVFVHPPDGADPDAGRRPRFMIVDALAEAVSADPVNLVTPAEPLSHAFVGDEVVSSVWRFEDGREVAVFESSFPRPDPDRAEVARFTREMAIGNDYIYWANGVYDRVLYNATTFNHDAYFIDTSQLVVSDDSRWAQYLQPEVKDAVYYVNTLEYVASPMANLRSEHLDVTPDRLAELLAFKTNGHQAGLMRTAVEQLFRGEANALVGLRVADDTPSTYYHFEITDPAALSEIVDLPPGHRLAPVQLLDGAPERYYLTLSVYEVEDAIEGTRAEWSVYTDDGSGRPHTMILDLMTEEVAVDPVSIVELPSDVRHAVDDGVVTTRVSSPSAAVTFEASFDTTGAADDELALDWIEAGDVVCRLNGICDQFFYDAETLDVPVHRPIEVTVDEFSTPWDDYVGATPAVVFYRDNEREYVVKRWYDLQVRVDELPFGGLADRTHAISGSGTLTGRDSDVADSTYTYSGDAVLDGDLLTFAIDQEVDNALGVGHIYTTGSFDLTTGTGTQTVVDCIGPALLCSDIQNGSTAFYRVQRLDASDPDAITWGVDVVIDLGGSFGVADSSSTLTAARLA